MIRTYQDKDFPKIIAIWLEAQTMAHPFLQPDFVKTVKDMMEQHFIPNSKTWVYQNDQTVIGFIAMMQNEIGGLFVMPNEQQRGVGGMLLAYVEKFHEHLEVEVFDKNRIGKPFYFKHGFIQTSQYTHEATNEKVLRLIRINTN